MIFKLCLVVADSNQWFQTYFKQLLMVVGSLCLQFGNQQKTLPKTCPTICVSTRVLIIPGALGTAGPLGPLMSLSQPLGPGVWCHKLDLDTWLVPIAFSTSHGRRFFLKQAPQAPNKVVGLIRPLYTIDYGWLWTAITYLPPLPWLTMTMVIDHHELKLTMMNCFLMLHTYQLSYN